MLDIGWSEMLVIAAVAIIVVGPKDMLGMLRTIGRTFGQIQRMAADFKGQFNDALREAEFDEINRSVKDLERNNPLKQASDSLKADLDKSVKDIPKQIDQAGNGSAASKGAAGKGVDGAAAGAGAIAAGGVGQGAGQPATERTVKMVDTPIAPAHSLGAGYGAPIAHANASQASVVEKAEKAFTKPAAGVQPVAEAADAVVTPVAGSEGRRISVAERAEKAWKSAIGDDSSA